jgi:hypothetical protein
MAGMIYRHRGMQLSYMREWLKRVSVLLLFFVACSAARASAAGLPFIQEDYGHAIAQAKGRNLPIFVECWAPW